MRARIAYPANAALCAFMAVAVGGGFYEGLITNPLWSRSPPSSLSLLQPGTGVPLQTFWMPVHAAITAAAIVALAAAWRDRGTRRWLLVGLGSYFVMRAWSFAYFIPEMLELQKLPLDAPPTPELTARVARWTSLSWWRGVFDVASLASFFLALRQTVYLRP
jgi:hypothetical protein